MSNLETRAWEAKNQILREILKVFCQRNSKNYSRVLISSVLMGVTLLPGESISNEDFNQALVSGGTLVLRFCKVGGSPIGGTLPGAPLPLIGSCLWAGYILGLGRLKRDWCLLDHVCQWVGLMCA